MSKQLIEDIDYYINHHGLMVMMEKYHLDRGYCCGNGCRHCPFEYEAVPEPRRSFLRKNSDKNIERKTDLK